MEFIISLYGEALATVTLALMALPLFKKSSDANFLGICELEVVK